MPKLDLPGYFTASPVTLVLGQTGEAAASGAADTAATAGMDQAMPAVTVRREMFLRSWVMGHLSGLVERSSTTGGRIRCGASAQHDSAPMRWAEIPLCLR